MQQIDLSGRHALVTGGGSGIGLAIARALADAGAEVTITGRRQAALEAAAEGAARLHPLAMDVSDEASVVAGTAAAIAARGPVTICVANAGIAEGDALHRSELAQWRRIMATNLDGAYLTVRESLKAMRKGDWGRVIGVSSIAGLRGLKGAVAYTASKHGLIGLMRGLAAEYAGTGLTFNALCPGYVATEIVTRNAAAIAGRTGMSEAEAVRIMAGTNAHGQLIDAGDVAAAALWLCGPGSGTVNGQAIEIAGGQV